VISLGIVGYGKITADEHVRLRAFQRDAWGRESERGRRPVHSIV